MTCAGTDGVHDDSKPARVSAIRAYTHRGALRDGKRPVLQFQWRYPSEPALRIAKQF